MSRPIAHDSIILPIIAKQLIAQKGKWSRLSNDVESGVIQELPARAERIIKAAMNAGNLSDPEWVANVTDANLASHAFIESLTSTSAFVSMLTGNNIWRVPLRTPISVNATAATGYVVGEGMGKPLSRLSMTRLTIPLLKAICMCVISDEVAKNQSSASQAYVSRQLRQGAAEALDATFLARIVDTSTPIINSNGTTAAAAAGDLKNLLSMVPNTGNQKLFFVASADVAIAAATLTDTAGQFVFLSMSPDGGELLGVPCFVSAGVDAGELYLVDASGIAGDVEAATIEISNQATVEMDDAPAQDSTVPTATSGTVVSLWQANSHAIRCTIWFGVERIRADAVAKLDQIGWGPAVTT